MQHVVSPSRTRLVAYSQLSLPPPVSELYQSRADLLFRWTLLLRHPVIIGLVRHRLVSSPLHALQLLPAQCALDVALLGGGPARRAMRVELERRPLDRANPSRTSPPLQPREYPQAHAQSSAATAATRPPNTLGCLPLELHVTDPALDSRMALSRSPTSSAPATHPSAASGALAARRTCCCRCLRPSP